MLKPKIYLASKLHHAQKLRDLRTTWKDQIVITSRWLDMTHIELEENIHLPEVYTWCWALDIRDILNSDYLIVYGKPDDNLRGACVEAGVALGNDMPVFCIGNCPSYGTWQYHPQVVRVLDINQAIDICIEWHNRRESL